MNAFNTRYPEIFQMTGYFADWDVSSTSFEDLAWEYKTDCSPELLQRVLLEIDLLIEDSASYASFSNEININFKSDDETIAFLQMIKTILKTAMQVNSIAPTMSEGQWCAPLLNGAEDRISWKRDSVRMRYHPI